MSPAVVLLPAVAHAAVAGGELLPPDATPLDALGPGPLVAAASARLAGCVVSWLAHASAELNEAASRLANQPVRGDACVVVADAAPGEIECLLRGRLPRRKRACSAGAGADGGGLGAPSSPTRCSSIAAAALSAQRFGGGASGGSGDATTTAAINCSKRRHLEAPATTAAAATAAAEEAAAVLHAPPAQQINAATEPAAAADPVAAPWADLPAHVVSSVALRLGPSVAAVAPVLSACRAWRAALLGDDQLLRALAFRLDARAPFRSEHRLPPAALRGYLRATCRHPRLLARVRG